MARPGIATDVSSRAVVKGGRQERPHLDGPSFAGPLEHPSGGEKQTTIRDHIPSGPPRAAGTSIFMFLTSTRAISMFCLPNPLEKRLFHDRSLAPESRAAGTHNSVFVNTCVDRFGHSLPKHCRPTQPSIPGKRYRMCEATAMPGEETSRMCARSHQQASFGAPRAGAATTSVKRASCKHIRRCSINAPR